MTDNCFLCEPNPKWVYARSDNFFAMTGVGPITEGYSIIASKDHIPCILDIPPPLILEFLTFSEKIYNLISNIYKAPILTEHGRLGICSSLKEDGSFNHCFHAHQLIFPINTDIIIPFLKIFPNSTKLEYQSEVFNLNINNEYLFIKFKSNSILITEIDGSIKSQFFRRLFAKALGKSYLYDWCKHPNLSLVDNAAKKLCSAWGKYESV